jgi:hypothetical protein
MAAPDKKPPAKNMLEDLHPSWIAKKKQSGMKEFKGSRIVFDDESV